MTEPTKASGPGTGLIRKRVVERVLQAYEYPVTAVVAPAGFGKTTAIRHVLLDIPGAIFVRIPALCTLQQFILEFAHCCSAQFPAMIVPPDTLPSALDDTNQAIDIFFSWSLAHMKNVECTIAIDDIQNAEALGRGAISYIVRIVDATKEHIKWILSSRVRRVLPLTRWQAYGDSDTPISADDLRITFDEAVDLAITLRSPATRDDLKRWIEQTNGFAVPLAHAIRTSATRGTADFIMDRTRAITFEYLAEQIWSSLTDEDQRLLEIASLLPPIHVDHLEDSNIPEALFHTRRLANDIAFLTIGSHDIFTMHDLFRDFIQQQILARGSATLNSRRREAADLLIRAGQFEAALRNLTDSQDFEYISSVVELCDFQIIDNSLIRIICEAASATLPKHHGIKMLLLQADFWSWFGDSNRARVLAEEILAREGARSEQILRATRIMFRALSLVVGSQRTNWIERFPKIAARLEQPDKNVSEAWLSAFLAQKIETQEASRNLLRVSSPGIAALLPSSRVDALIMVSIAHFYLGDLASSIVAARAAVVAADVLGDLREQARAMNTLGIALWNAYDPEIEFLFEPLRNAVERSGSWAFSQASHWLPASFYILAGNEVKTSATTSLVYNAPSVSESTLTRLRPIQQHTENLANILIEKYREVKIGDVRSDRENQNDMSYELATDSAIAFALEANFSASESSLTRAKELRKSLSAFESVSILESVFIETICLGANGQWVQARRLRKQSQSSIQSLAKLEKALDRFCDGPPFAGLDEMLLDCYEKPYIGLIALIAKRVADRFRREPYASALSSAERDVLDLLCLGKSNKAIADARSRSPETIKRQIAAIFRKLGVDNRTSAVAVAREKGLI